MQPTLSQLRKRVCSRLFVQLMAAIFLCFGQFFTALITLAQDTTSVADLRLNQIQVIGTHNSYHIAPSPGLLKAIRLVAPSTADAIDYTHQPLAEQFEKFKVRQIELDIYADPVGGLFSNPIGYQSLSPEEQQAEGNPNPSGVLDKPGMKIIHSPGFDYRTTVHTLVQALQQVKDWSAKNPNHVPIMILIELKESTIGPSGVTPVKFGKNMLDAVDAEIRTVFSEDKIVTPDQVRGDHATLRAAVQSDGWPKLKDCLGKVLFALDNGGSIRDLYIEDHPSLEKRMMFASVPPDHPAAAFIKLNDPIAEFDQIQAAVRQGLIVRTRADADTHQARSGDTKRFQSALASGAQFISTDYPQPDSRFTDYHVRIENGQEYRRNPLFDSQ